MNKELIYALEIVLELAYDNALDPDDYADDRGLSDIFWEEAKRQDKCLGIVQKHIEELKKNE